MTTLDSPAKVNQAKADIDSAYDLSAAQIDCFHKNGFVKLKNVLQPDTLHSYGQVITQQTLALNDDHRPIEERSTYEKAFLQIMNLWEYDAQVREFVFSRKLAKIAADLLGVTGVRLYHDQSLYKEPNSGVTPAHSDQYYWPLSSDKTVTAWIPLQAVSAEMGPLAFYSESQSVEFGRELAISDESEQLITRQMEEQGFDLVDEPFDLGDVSFHTGWTFHKAGANRSASPRSVMTMIYMDVEMRLTTPQNPMQKNDWETWCPGTNIGEIIETPKNPVLYSAKVLAS